MTSLDDELQSYTEDLEKKISEKSKELELLRNINNAINHDKGLPNILKIIVDGVNSAFDYIASAVFLLSENRQFLILKSYSVDSKTVKQVEKLTGIRADGYRIPLFEGSIFKNLVVNQEPIINYPDQADYWAQWTDKKNLQKVFAKVGPKVFSFTGSGIDVPIIAKGTTIGMISSASDKKMLEKEDMQRLVAFGEQVGLAVQRGRLYEEWLKQTELKSYIQMALEIIG